MINFPWKSTKKNVDNLEKNDLQINKSIQDTKQDKDANDNYSENSSDGLIENIHKTYKYEDLPLDAQELVKLIKVADLQIQCTKDTISMIRPTRDQIYSDLRDKLKHLPLM